MNTNLFEIKRTVLLLVLFIVVLFCALSFYKERKTAAEHKIEADYIEKISQGSERAIIAAELVGKRWKRGKKSDRQDIFYFAPDGSLPYTIIEASGEVTAPLLYWKTEGARLIITDFNGNVKKDYVILGYGNGKVYVRSRDGTIESYVCENEVDR